MANIDNDVAKWLEKMPDWLLIALATLALKERAQLPMNPKVARIERKLSAYAEKLERRYQH